MGTHDTHGYLTHEYGYPWGWILKDPGLSFDLRIPMGMDPGIPMSALMDSPSHTGEYQSICPLFKDQRRVHSVDKRKKARGQVGF